jgi:hypothetical protein
MRARPGLRRPANALLAGLELPRQGDITPAQADADPSAPGGCQRDRASPPRPQRRKRKRRALPTVHSSSGPCPVCPLRKTAPQAGGGRPCARRARRRRNRRQRPGEPVYVAVGDCTPPSLPIWAIRVHVHRRSVSRPGRRNGIGMVTDPGRSSRDFPMCGRPGLRRGSGPRPDWH